MGGTVVSGHLQLDVRQELARFNEQTAALELRYFMRPQPCTPTARALFSTPVGLV